MTDRLASPRLLFWLCFLVAAVDGFDTLVVSFIAPAFAEEWQLSSAEVGQIFGAGLLGAAIGGMVAGPIADRLGRRAVLLGSVLLFSIVTLFCALAPNPAMLGIFRFVAGFGLGGAIPTITALVAETMPAERRAAAVTRMFLGFPIGAVVGGAICSVIVEPFGWRSAFWLGGALGVILLPILWRWVGETIAAAPAKGHAHGGSVRGTLAEGRALSAVMLWAGAFFILLVSYFLINWTPTILSESGLPERYAILGGVVLNLGGVTGAVLLTFILDRRGPFRLAGIVLAAGAIIVFLLGTQLHNPVLLAPLVFVAGMAVIGGQLTLPALASTLFPVAVRATGVGFTMGIGRAGSILGPFLGGFLIDAELGWTLLFLVIAIPTLLAGLLVLFAGFRLPTGPHAAPARS